MTASRQDQDTITDAIQWHRLSDSDVRNLAWVVSGLDRKSPHREHVSGILNDLGMTVRDLLKTEPEEP